MALSWLINGGDPNHLQVLGAHPPSSQSARKKTSTNPSLRTHWADQKRTWRVKSGGDDDCEPFFGGRQTSGWKGAALWEHLLRPGAQKEKHWSHEKKKLGYFPLGLGLDLWDWMGLVYLLIHEGLVCMVFTQVGIQEKWKKSHMTFHEIVVV